MQHATNSLSEYAVYQTPLFMHDTPSKYTIINKIHPHLQKAKRNFAITHHMTDLVN